MVLVFTISLILSIPLHGQEPGRQAGQPVPGGPQSSPLVAALDINSDGEISAAELTSAPESIKKLDKNGDGQIDATELRPAGRGGGREGRGGREGGGREGGRGANPNQPGETPATSPDDLVALLMAFDKNGDGQLVKAELPERMQAVFDRADTDNNGKLTADEIRKSAAAAPQPNAMQGRGREGGRGPAMTDPLVAALDLNKDGALDGAEIAASAASLRTLDKNTDGKLNADEYRAAQPAGRMG